MKKLGLIIILAGLVNLTHAQETEERKVKWPYWTISKDVQRLPYRNTVFTPVKMSVGDVTLTSSKGVQQINTTRSPKRTGYVETNGYPAWTISKGPARLQAKRNSK